MDIATKPRLLTTFEITAFLARHPIIATQVAATKAAILIGAYDFDIYTTSAEWGVLTVRFPGIIEPRGIQVQDSVFGLVTIQPAPSGMYFSGYSPVIGDADKPEFNSPPNYDFFGDLTSALMFGALIVGVILLRKK